MDKLLHVALKDIDVGENPRRIFDTEKMTEFELSIKKQGIIQSILIIPGVDGRYKLVAGGRRYRAAYAVHGPEYMAPAILREVDEDTAARLALIENTDRENMTAVEEAEAAYAEVQRCDGNVESAANNMGWPILKLRKRISLMRCTNEVRQSLDRREISSGHAELLAAVTSDKQLAALPLIIQHHMTVEQLKSQLINKARKLGEAIFDKTECTQCPHNSEVQADLFSVNIGSGSCTNAPCFVEKTNRTVAERAADMRESYPKVVMLAIDASPAMTPLIVEGDHGVGHEQAEACKTCKDFGATISTLPGEEGNVRKSVCFNLACNADKVLSFNQPEPLPEPDVATSKVAKPSATNTLTEQRKSPVTSAKDASPKAPPAHVASVIKSSALRAGLLDYRRSVWNDALVKTALNHDPVKIRRLLVLLGWLGEINAINTQDYASAMFAKAAKGGLNMPKTVLGLTKKITSTFAFIENAPESDLNKFVGGLLACAAPKLQLETLGCLLEASGEPVDSFWKPDTSLWALLTKSEIDAVGSEIGLSAHFADKWKPLLLKKKAEIETEIAKSGFDFDAKIPNFMKWN